MLFVNKLTGDLEYFLIIQHFILKQNPPENSGGGVF